MDAKRIGVQFETQCLVLEYFHVATNKLRHRRLYLNKLLPEGVQNLEKDATKVMQKIYKDHHAYFHAVSNTKVIAIITNELQLRSAIKALLSAAMQEDIHSSLLSSPVQEEQQDYNKLDDRQLKQVKSAMDVQFHQNRITPGNNNYKYDIRKEFKATEASDWDD